MEGLGVDKVFLDKVSGKDANRPYLKEMMEFVRSGDTVIVESINRFARNTKDLLELIERLNQKGVEFISQKESIDTTTPAGKFMLVIFAAVAELERECIRERQREGIDIAKGKGKMGRPEKAKEEFDSVFLMVKSGEISASEACRRLEIARSTWYRKVNKHNQDEIIDF